MGSVAKLADDKYVRRVNIQKHFEYLQREKEEESTEAGIGEVVLISSLRNTALRQGKKSIFMLTLLKSMLTIYLYKNFFPFF